MTPAADSHRICISDISVLTKCSTRSPQSEDWTPDHVSSASHGKRNGWWGMSEHAESFLDELITWRELGYNMCCQRDRLRSIRIAARLGPDTRWQKHAARSARSVCTLGEFETAADARSSLERGPAATGPRGPHTQLLADVVGQEDPALVRLAAGRVGNHDRAEQQVRRRRPQPQLVQRHFLDARDATTAPGARNGRSSARSAI